MRIIGIDASDLAELEMDKLSLKHARGNHAIVLARNGAGLKDLYKMVSYAHVDYMGAHPFVPKRILKQLRSHLLGGSACFNSEVFYASTNRSMEELEEVMKDYDYVEIQPLENYRWLIDMKQIPNEEMLKQYIMDIIEVAEKLGKMIVATGDVHLTAHLTNYNVPGLTYQWYYQTRVSGVDTLIDDNFKYTITYSPYEGVLKDVTFNVGTVKVGEVIRVDGDEVRDIMWLNYKEAQKHLTYDANQNLS